MDTGVQRATEQCTTLECSLEPLLITIILLFFLIQTYAVELMVECPRKCQKYQDCQNKNGEQM